MTYLSINEYFRLGDRFKKGKILGLFKFKTAPILRMKPGVVPPKFVLRKRLW